MFKSKSILMSCCLGLLVFLSIASVAQAHSLSPRKPASDDSMFKGGAGCIATDGSLITFLDCGAVAAPKPTVEVPDLPSPIDLPSEQPAELSQLIEFIKASPTIPSLAQESIIGALQPDAHRKYFSVRPAALTTPSEKRILFQFTRAVGLQPNGMRLYAVTDTNAHYTYLPDPGKVTYLLPGFYQLRTPQERMAALFHEAWWILHPNLTDEKSATAVEAIFQAILNDPSNPIPALKFNQFLAQDDADAAKKQGDRDHHNLFGSYKGLDHELALKIDLQTGALKGFINEQNQISSYQLFGSVSSIRCFKAPTSQDPYDQAGFDNCYVAYMIELSRMRQTWPHSLFLAMVVDLAKDLHEQFRASPYYASDFFEKLVIAIQGESFKVYTSTPGREHCFFSCRTYGGDKITYDPLYDQLWVTGGMNEQPSMIQLNTQSPRHQILAAVVSPKRDQK